jgi:hypothetical protein
MKINEAPAFCPVCQRALERLILFYTEKWLPYNPLPLITPSTSS